MLNYGQLARLSRENYPLLGEVRAICACIIILYLNGTILHTCAL